MNKITRPMLAVAVKDLTKLTYPMYLSPKIDGIRCIKVNGICLSRKFKPIPNTYIRDFIEKNLPDGVDGELTSGANFNETQSDIMSIDGEPNFVYNIFDYVKHSCLDPFNNRYMDLLLMHNKLPKEVKTKVVVVEQYTVSNAEEVQLFEQQAIDRGYEGIMLRSFNSPYKNGRSTLKEEYLLKVKRFYDAEAEVVGFLEQMHNANKAEKDAFGRTKRSSKKAGLVPAGILGELLLKDLQTGLEFGCGTGLSQELRKQIWDHQDDYKGKLVTYASQSAGKKHLPRFPVFKGFRHTDDL